MAVVAAVPFTVANGTLETRGLGFSKVNNGAGNGTMTVTSNVLQVTSSDASYRYDTSTGETDHYAEIDVTFQSGGDYCVGGVITRMNSGGGDFTGIVGIWGFDNWSVIYALFEIDAGSFSLLASASAPTPTAGVAKTMRLESEGDTHTLYADAVSVVSGDSTLGSANTRTGVYGYEYGGGAVSFDNFEVGNFIAPPVGFTGSFVRIPSGAKARTRMSNSTAASVRLSSGLRL